MAYTVTDQQVCNELQMHLLEVPNNGASYGSALYTATEIADIMTRRMQDLYVEASIVTAIDVTQVTTANSKSAPFPPDLIDIVRLGYGEA